MDQVTDIVRSLTSAQGKGMSFASEVARQARDFGLGIPILYWIGWLFVAYFLLYFLAVYVGPALFGTRPWGRPMYWGRNVATPVRFPPPNPYVRASGYLPGMDVPEATEMTARVTQAIKKQP